MMTFVFVNNRRPVHHNEQRKRITAVLALKTRHESLLEYISEVLLGSLFSRFFSNFVLLLLENTKLQGTEVPRLPHLYQK